MSLRDDALRLMKFPFSKCDCATGVGWCAHKGSMLLLTFLLRECFKEKCHKEAVQCLPCPVFSVAAQPVPLHFVYQNPRSQDVRMVRAIRKSMMEVEVDYSSDDDSQTEHSSSNEYDDDETGAEHDYNDESDAEYDDDDNESDGEEYDDDMSDASALDSDYEPTSELDDDDMERSRIDLCGEMKKFAVAAEESLMTRDQAHHVDMEKLRQSAKLAASLPTSVRDAARKNIRLQRMHQSVESGQFYPSMASWYAAYFVERSSANAGDIDNVMDVVVFHNEGGKKLADNVKRLQC